MFPGEQRISVQWNSCICRSASTSWHIKLDSVVLTLHLPAPLCSLLWSPPSLEVLLSPRCDSTEASPSPFTSLNPYFLGHQGHHTMSFSVAFPTWHPGLGSLLLVSEEDFASVFPLSRKFLLLLISELIFTSLGRVWAHLLHADRAVQCLPGLWCT